MIVGLEYSAPGGSQITANNGKVDSSNKDLSAT